MKCDKPGKIIILNGTPRSGKSSIAKVIQDTYKGVWMNLGVDQFMQMTPLRYQPGIGLRPGGEKPALEPAIMVMYQAMYEAIASFSKLGLNVVADVGHHDGYSVPRGILTNCIKILSGFQVLFVGVRCPIEVIMERRINTWNAGYTAEGKIPAPIRLWQELVHVPGIYDLEVDTSLYSPEACAKLIYSRLEYGPPPDAFKRIQKLEKV